MIFTSLLPIISKVFLYFIGVFVKKQETKAALTKQWLDSIAAINHGVLDSVQISDMYKDAKAKLDAKIAAMPPKVGGQ